MSNRASGNQPAQTSTPEQSGGRQSHSWDRAIVGVVKDPSSAVLANATVTLSSQSDRQERTATSDANGAFIFSDLPLDVYFLTVQMSGFQTLERRNLVLALEKKLEVQLTLAVGTVTMGGPVYAEPVKHHKSPLHWLKKK